ncbi:SLC13 family permease [Clostridium saccharobutylicum]|uniref:Transporter n=1 Tax=Clostridium saccharobutylicum DSM 13864 TaxID=1345695 RepID=U5MS65_CLOSA|nr:SLC13 family permease [Clostridium saccharobutylicum]AGX43420.1 transporter [Clostridium saccharobutylicum DSM 13864]AQR90719.1 inner membrane protein YbiR [Clostridium saccharobutylicum]AQS00623.1 inner membrane protein YbiR [Clostridium saccharobutylicum]AQS14606.1 inner membrane protein YbiR [Clostridium saccharobutylicum]MBA2907221.1 Na+/H+ antiporter NhaD/arsenite permease-like protein [Clostridium saccharobutylicum]
MNIKQLFTSSIVMLKTEVVFTISLVLAFTTSIITKPQLNYINFQVLILMFNLMIVIGAFEKFKLLDKVAVEILRKNTSLRMVSTVLVSLCFVSSMFITNDVALISFVPLTMIIAKKAGFNPMKIIILETLAANIGSSFTPMGNPQNLYLFSFFNISILTFFKSTIFFVISGGVWLFILNQKISNVDLKFDLDKIEIKNTKAATIYCVLFMFILLSVFDVIDYRVAFIITICVSLILERKLFKELDYILLLTFVCFFIAIGNLSNMQSISEIMKKLLNSDSGIYFSAIFFSQLISNVPCAILLSKFTNSWRPILIGVNVGGMGTIIASLASLISYKFYSKEYDGKKYLYKFIKYNFGSLIIFAVLFSIFLYL